MQPVPSHFEVCMADLGPSIAEIRTQAKKTPFEGPPWSVLDQMFEWFLARRVLDQMDTMQLASLYLVCERIAAKYDYNPYHLFAARETKEIEAWFLARYNPMLGRDLADRSMLGDIRSMLHKCYQMACHQAHGKRVFAVSPGLADKLAHTELRGLSTDDVRLPYESVYIQVPEEAGLIMAGFIGVLDQDFSNPVAGIYVTYGSEFGRELYPDEKTERGLDILAVSMPDKRTAHDQCVRFGIPLPPGAKLDDILARMNDIYQKRADEAPELGFEKMKDRWLAIFRWMLNVLIYATWPDADRTTEYGNPEFARLYRRREKAPKKSTKRKKLSAQLKEHDPKTRFVLGAGVSVIDRSTTNGSSSKGNGNPLTVRTLVSGHWRRYHIGKGRTETVWRHIEPFWRGPKDAPETNPTHEVR
jgi:hypothetical protein